MEAMPTNRCRHGFGLWNTDAPDKCKWHCCAPVPVMWTERWLEKVNMGMGKVKEKDVAREPGKGPVNSLNTLHGPMGTAQGFDLHDAKQAELEQAFDQAMEGPSAWDSQVGGSHYKNKGIQPMHYSMANGLDGCQHTIVKYVTRFREKGGVQDLRKARHVLDMLIEWEEKQGKINVSQ